MLEAQRPFAISGVLFHFLLRGKVLRWLTGASLHSSLKSSSGQGSLKSSCFMLPASLKICVLLFPVFYFTFFIVMTRTSARGKNKIVLKGVQ